MNNQPNLKQYFGSYSSISWDPARATKINKNFSNIDNYKHAALLPKTPNQYGTTSTYSTTRK